MTDEGIAYLVLGITILTAFAIPFIRLPLAEEQKLHRKEAL